MKEIGFYILLFVAMITYSQETSYNIQEGYIAGGYDVVTYFDVNPAIGDESYVYTFNDLAFKLSSERTLNLFKNSSNKFIPEYGGWCTYAIALKNEKLLLILKRMK